MVSHDTLWDAHSHPFRELLSIHRIEVLDLLTGLNRSRGTTIVMVPHDLDLAARYADRLIALAAGGLYASGTPAEVLTEETVRAVFDLDSRIIEDPVSGRPLMLPIGHHSPGPGRGTARRGGDRVNAGAHAP